MPISKTKEKNSNFDNMCQKLMEKFDPVLFMEGLLEHVGVSRQIIDGALYGDEAGNLAPNNRRNTFTYKDVAIADLAYFRFPKAGSRLDEYIDKMKSLRLIQSQEHGFKVIICCTQDKIAIYDLKNNVCLVCELKDLCKHKDELSALFADGLDITKLKVKPRALRATEPNVDTWIDWREKKAKEVSLSVDESAALQFIALIDELVKHNGLDDNRLDLGDFVLRLWFCLFADDYKLFGKDKKPFLSAFKSIVSEDGSNAKQFFGDLFRVIATPDSKRNSLKSSVDERLLKFAYIEGDFFSGEILVPEFNAQAVSLLLALDTINWTKISVVLFSSLIEYIMVDYERSAVTECYTQGKKLNWLAKELYLDEFEERYDSHEQMMLQEQVKATEAEDDDTARKAATKYVMYAKNFIKLISNEKFLDPACGCANLLAYAYQDCRRFETKIYAHVKSFIKDCPRAQQFLKEGIFEPLGIDSEGSFVNVRSCIDLNNFGGIEIEPWLVQEAHLSMWMVQHVCDCRLNKRLGAKPLVKPINSMEKIVLGDALEIDWNKIIKADECTFILSHLPMSMFGDMSKAKLNQVKKILDGCGLIEVTHYSSAWVKLAATYMQNNDSISAAMIVPIVDFDFDRSSRSSKFVLNNCDELPNYSVKSSFPWPNELGNAEDTMTDVFFIGDKFDGYIEDDADDHIFDEEDDEADDGIFMLHFF